MWDKSLLNTSGTLKVAVLSIPTISNVPLSGPDIVISGAGGPANETYHVLAATNEALPLTNGSRMATNVFDGNGNFSFTNAITTPPRCYLLQLP